MTTSLTPYKVMYDELAIEDLKALDGSVKQRIVNAIAKVAQNPLPRQEGGMGWPLGNKQGINLANFLKIKMRGIGYRVVYELHRTEKSMEIIIISVREDNEVYKEAYKRILQRKI